MENEQNELIRYFAFMRNRMYCEEGWCVNKKIHVYRRAVDFGNAFTAGTWQTLDVSYLGQCDKTKCKEFTTTNLKEIKKELIDPECIERKMPLEFRLILDMTASNPNIDSEGVPEDIERFLK